MTAKLRFIAYGGALVAVAAMAVTGCQKSESTSPDAVVSAPPAPQMRASAPDTPESTGVRPASEALGSAPSAPVDGAGAQDRGREDAAGEASKEQETKSMPLGGQANNYNSQNDTYRVPTPPAKE